MKLFSILVIGIILGFGSSVLFFNIQKNESVAVPGVYPIDTLYKECANRPLTNPNRCATEAQKNWDEEMEKTLSLLKNGLDNEGVLALEKSQSAWKEYQTREKEVIRSLYKNKSGSMYIPFEIYDNLEVTRARTLLLKDYLDPGTF